MAHHFGRLTAAAGILLVAAICAPPGRAADCGPPPGTQDLFYNYYVPPGPSGGVGAQLYVSPRPTPPLVGHTYVTYQPLMPHEFLYHHQRTYVTKYSDGRTRTHVAYRSYILPTWFAGGINLIPILPH